MVMPGVICLQINTYSDAVAAANEMSLLDETFKPILNDLKGIVQIIVCDDATFTAASLNNYLWVTYTRCNPSHDIHGVAAFTEHKHWGCKGPMIIDARIKPHHAPPVLKDPAIEKDRQTVSEGRSLSSIVGH